MCLCVAVVRRAARMMTRRGVAGTRTRGPHACRWARKARKERRSGLQRGRRRGGSGRGPRWRRAARPRTDQHRQSPRVAARVRRRARVGRLGPRRVRRPTQPHGFEVRPQDRGAAKILFPLTALSQVAGRRRGWIMEEGAMALMGRVVQRVCVSGVRRREDATGTRWEARITAGKHSRYLGCFDTELQAALEYDRWAHAHGERGASH